MWGTFYYIRPGRKSTSRFRTFSNKENLTPSSILVNFFSCDKMFWKMKHKGERVAFGLQFKGKVHCANGCYDCFALMLAHIIYGTVFILTQIFQTCNLDPEVPILIFHDWKWVAVCIYTVISILVACKCAICS